MMGRSALRIVAVASFFAVAPAYGVLIGPGDGTQNTTQGTMVDGWNNVGHVGAASAVYLGDGWVITGQHVGTFGLGTTVSFGSLGNFTVDQASVRLKNPDNTNADLQMLHLGTSPALPSLQIAAASPSYNTFIYMAGYGQNRAADPVYYDVTQTSISPPHYSWTPAANPSEAFYGGFTGSGSTKRWGTNETTYAPNSTDTLTGVTNAGFGPTHVFYATFYDDLNDYEQDTATVYEAQLVPGDSGGGVFNAANELIGLNLYQGPFIDQPTTVAMFGNYAIMADLSVYRDQILSVMAVPEPTGMALIGCLLPLLVRRRRVSRPEPLQ